MNAKSKYLIRRAHRFLGVLIGIQFMGWTLGGLYFSWSDMDEVHGDYERAPASLIAADGALTYPTPALLNLHNSGMTDSLAEIRLATVMGKPCWQIFYFPKGHERHHKAVALADAQTGLPRPELSKEEAVETARRGYAGKGHFLSAEYLSEAGGHHEYRENPLPAYAVHFDDARRTTVYVSTQLGTVQKIRNRPWRFFDFLWMLHTMDYNGRDNITNWLLRAFSIFGLATVCSGFLLFFTSRKIGGSSS